MNQQSTRPLECWFLDAKLLVKDYQLCISRQLVRRWWKQIITPDILHNFQPKYNNTDNYNKLTCRK